MEVFILLLCAHNAIGTPVLPRQELKSYDCVPGMQCWPSLDQWTALNETLGGRLRRTIPYAAPCYPTHQAYNTEECEAVRDNYTNGTARSAVYGAMQGIQYEACGATDCQLVSVAPGIPPLFETCELGRMSAYYVDALNASHIADTLKFVARHDLRLSIKNTGHDYLGRSSAPNSLALWTHNMKEMKYFETWTANSCSWTSRTNIGEVGEFSPAEISLLTFREVPAFKDLRHTASSNHMA